MKILGAQYMKRKEEGCSSRVSPSKLEDIEYAKKNLLAGDLDDEVVGFKDSPVSSINAKSQKSEFCNKELSRYGEGFQTQSSTANSLSKGNSETKYSRNQNNSSNSSYQSKLGNNYCTVHPMKHQEVDDDGYDSGHESASNSNFEFHRRGKVSQLPIMGHFSRHIPSKWNDAEKWLVNKQVVHENGLKNNSVQYQCNRLVNSSLARIAPESINIDQKPFVIQPSASNSNSQNMVDKFSFVSQGLHANSASLNDESCVTDPSEGINYKNSSVSEGFPSGTTDISAKQLVSMRDVGTEMTPIPSQEPSRTATPIENLTPSRSPLSSNPSSPRIGSVAVDRMPSTDENEKDYQKDGKKVEFSERELQLKTRQEIAALGLQLGKLNIASWASKETEQNSQFNKKTDEEEQVKQEYEACAAAWEEAEKSKHLSRYKREEIKILVWESHQRAKYEASLRKVEIRAVNMRSRAEAAMAEKLRRAERKAAEKRANAQAIMNLQTARISDQADSIRRSGRVPSHFRCCSWFL
ncbi:cell division cycle 2-like [Dendrobium catenatum]|uniref:Cell division cycle 2-like n=2 Tax=Dendrobium catenatum TaxID=906689 RepID=A0A2I0X7I9_9ASPA|nr:cell division cycle 2-like [Dendrobium catenatum]